MLAWFQHRMIYHPRSYGTIYQQYFNESLQRLTYQTSEGSQTAFYQPPPNGKPPKALWILFGGNAALALDWMWLVEESSISDLGFLLIDYPGFGESEGRASPENILVSSEVAWKHWKELHATHLTPQIGILGHSLGAAAALTGITSYLMCLFSQTLYSEAEVREKDTYEDLTQYYVNGGK